MEYLNKITYALHLNLHLCIHLYCLSLSGSRSGAYTSYHWTRDMVRLANQTLLHI